MTKSTGDKSLPIRIVSSDNKAQIRRIFSRRAERLDEAERAVAPILAAVEREGDGALLRYAKQWDGFQGSASDLLVSPSRIAASRQAVGPAFLRAARDAAENIRKFCASRCPGHGCAPFGPAFAWSNRDGPSIVPVATFPADATLCLPLC